MSHLWLSQGKSFDGKARDLFLRIPTAWFLIKSRDTQAEVQSVTPEGDRTLVFEARGDLVGVDMSWVGLLGVRAFLLATATRGPHERAPGVRMPKDPISGAVLSSAHEAPENPELIVLVCARFSTGGRWYSGSRC